MFTHIETDPVKHLLPRLVYSGQIAHAVDRGGAAGTAALIADSEHHIAPHHHLCQFLFTGIARFRLAHDPAVADDRDRIAQSHDLPQLMRDDNDRLPVFTQVFEVFNQPVHLLGHEHGGRLVQDQDIHIAVQHF